MATRYSASINSLVNVVLRIDASGDIRFGVICCGMSHGDSTVGENGGEKAIG